MFRLLNSTIKNLNKSLLKKYVPFQSNTETCKLYKLQSKHFFGFNSTHSSNPNNKKYYEILEVDQNASEDEIKRSFRKKAMLHHPDRGGDPDKFKEISKAYEVLSNKELRSKYDRFGEEGVQNNGGEDSMGDAEDLFANLFGGGFKGKPNTPKAQQKKVELVVTLEDIYNGVTKTIQFNRARSCKSCKGQGTNKPNGQTKCGGCNGSGLKTEKRYTQFGEAYTQTVCKECRGEGVFIKEVNKCGTCRGDKIIMESKKIEIDIQKGIKDGNFCVLHGEGDEIPNTKPGDLIVILKLAKHKHFERKGADIYYHLKINLLEALTGFEAVIPHFNGNNIIVKTHPGEVIKPGMTKTVKELGMPFFENSYKHGNLNIIFDIDFPSKLDVQDKELYENLLKNQFKRKIVNENVSNSYYMTDFSAKDANTSERGGRTTQSEENADSDGYHTGYDSDVKCKSQ